MKPLHATLTALICTSILISPMALAAEPELVLQEDVRLSATTASGTLRVIAGEGLARTYEWNGCSLESSMMARYERWYGARGIYDPADRGPVGLLFGKLFGCNGISRTVVEEAQIHFTKRSTAEWWIERQAGSLFESVWSNDGLLVVWGVSPNRQQLSVYVWQVCIAGLKPNQLRGARDEAIQLARVAGDGELRHECASVGTEALLDLQKR